jgi:DNA-binding transcriptional MerR regulator
MLIRELSQLTGLPVKTIRYYESIDLLPAPQRAGNNYRQYSQQAVERAQAVVSMRALGFSLAEIGNFLALRDKDTLLCEHVLQSVDRCLADVEQRIAELRALHMTLSAVRAAGAALPAGKQCGPQCLCHALHHPCATNDLSNPPCQTKESCL